MLDATPPDVRPVLVTGGTGTLGRSVVRTLLDAGRTPRVLSRHARTPHVPQPVEWVTGDLTSGDGLAEALDGAPTVVHCATSPRHRHDDIDAAARLLLAARAAGTEHIVYISIVGVDRVPFPYYETKLAVEHLVEAGGVPWTIQRATQFHELVATFLGAITLGPLTLVPSGLHDQPVDVREVAARLVALVEAGPSGRAPDLGGPQVLGLAELALQYQAARGRRGVVRSFGLPPGATTTAFRAGAHLTPEHADGRVTFAEHLARRPPR
ncbi:SDR family oxidoreductase [Cellulomonas sp. P22]|uniref:SDR family oxidoreductase n=1 Tax=Cellulomonas sp. P22 TaxID=3373189 RepID=UPI00378C67FA